MALVFLICATSSAQEAAMPPLRPDQVAFHALYKELVETNTTRSAGSCTLAAERLAARLKAAGYDDKDVTLFAVPEHPKEGGLVAILRGSSSTAKPMLLLGHLDVVEAKREDWTRDPFTLIQEGGYFYARGTADMKALAATWVDLLVRFKQGGYRPKRSIKLALTCGEENEAGGGRTDGHGKLLVQTMQVGEKAAQNYRLEAVNVGGHSSTPIRDNAIYELSDALLKVRDHVFPMKLSDTTRAYLAKSGVARTDDLGRAMVALSRNPDDAAAEAIVSTDRSYNSMLRTTCVATLLAGGHAENALPQSATATVNCRIFPGETVDGTLAALQASIGDPGVKVTVIPPVRPLAAPPPLDPKVFGPAKTLVARYFPGVPLIPSMSTGATDGIFLEAIGIPVYGVPGSWGDPDGNGTHGLNERNSVRSVYVGRDFLTDLVKLYAEAP
jgi:acetylornithine deacetylase/succinyl-diaminopimelate desuccinylase-like protein